MSNTRRGLPIFSKHGSFEKIFPKLIPTQLSRIAARGHIRAVKDGEVLYEQGHSAPTFFVVISGELEVVQPSTPVETLVTVYEPGQFTGEVGTLTGRRSLFRVRVTKRGKVIERHSYRYPVHPSSDASYKIGSPAIRNELGTRR